MIRELLQFVTSKLDELGIQYMLSGSVAMNLYYPKNDPGH